MLSYQLFLIDFLQDLKNSELEPFGYTEVNLTSFNLVESDFAISHYRPHFSFFEYVSVYDALLTVYELTRIQIQNTGLCYTGTKQALMDTLQQVSGPVKKVLYLCTSLRGKSNKLVHIQLSRLINWHPH